MSKYLLNQLKSVSYQKNCYYLVEVELKNDYMNTNLLELSRKKEVVKRLEKSVF